MRLEYDNNFATFVVETASDQQLLASLYHQFSVPLPHARFIQAHKLWIKTKGARGWDGIRRIVGVDGKFLTGLIPTVVDTIKSNGADLPLLVDKRNVPPFQFNLNEIDLRDYQKDIVKTCLTNTLDGAWWPRGIIASCTGSGKTRIAAVLYAMTRVPTLFVVHRLDLLYQCQEVFTELLKEHVGIVGGGKALFNPTGMTVTTVQTLQRMTRDPNVFTAISKSIQQVMVDEAHLISTKGRRYTSILEALPNAFLRWGLSGTPFMGDLSSRYALEGSIGAQLIQIKSKELIDQNFLAKPLVTYLDVPLPTPKMLLSSKMPWVDHYTQGIVLNPIRNRMIIEQVQKIEKPVLIIVSRLSHGEVLMEMARQAGITAIDYIDGSVDMAQRRSAVDRLNTGKLDVLFCSTIFDEGVDIPNLRAIILAAGGRSPVKLLQRAGRGLRLSKTKTKVRIIDFFDNISTLLKQHSLSREKIFRSEGFEVNLEQPRRV